MYWILKKQKENHLVIQLKTVQEAGTDNQVSNVTNNGATSGVVNWTPTAAGTYYYQCSAHDGMYGTITVQ